MSAAEAVARLGTADLGEEATNSAPGSGAGSRLASRRDLPTWRSPWLRTP